MLDANLSLVPGSLRTTPLALGQTLTMSEDSDPVSFTLLGADFDGDLLTYTILPPPVNGDLKVKGTLPNMTYEPTPDDSFGEESLTYQVCDLAVPANCDTAVVTINVLSVNDAPSFTVSSATQTVLEDSGAATVPGWATAISAGPANESGQALNFVVSNDLNSLFEEQPAVSASGTLTFKPATDQSGQAQVSVSLKDDGGSADGGSDTSAAQTFTIEVKPVNDAPAFTKGPDLTVLEDSGQQSIASWAAGITTGPNEAGQTLSFSVTGNTNPGLFSEAPALDADGTLTFTPADNMFGVAQVTLQLADNGGTAGGGVDTSAPQTFQITVQEDNDTPQVTPATFDLVENSPLGTLVGAVTYTDAEAGQAHTYSISAGNTSGAFTIDPISGVISVAKAAAVDFETTPTFTLTVTVTDDGSPAEAGSALVTINLSGVNEAPLVSSPTFSLPENSALNTVVGTVNVTDPEVGQTHTFEITAGNTSGAFAIGSTTGEITVATPGVLNYESINNRTFSLTVQATDNGSPALVDSGTVTVNLSDVNEAALVTSATFSVDEHSPNGTAAWDGVDRRPGNPPDAHLRHHRWRPGRRFRDRFCWHDYCRQYKPDQFHIAAHLQPEGRGDRQRQPRNDGHGDDHRDGDRHQRRSRGRRRSFQSR